MDWRRVASAGKIRIEEYVTSRIRKHAAATVRTEQSFRVKQEKEQPTRNKTLALTCCTTRLEKESKNLESKDQFALSPNINTNTSTTTAATACQLLDWLAVYRHHGGHRNDIRNTTRHPSLGKFKEKLNRVAAPGSVQNDDDDKRRQTNTTPRTAVKFDM
jgi:hypothetical protein